MEQTISLASARRILGAKAKTMTDDQVIELLTTLTLLAKDTLSYNGSKDYEYGKNNPAAN